MVAPWLAALMITGFVAVALYCATSPVVRGRPLDRLAATEANHVVMALAMVVMLLPGGMALVPLAVGVAVFAVLAGVWGVVRILGRGRVAGPPECGTDPVHLLLLNLAMVAMYTVMGTAAHGDHEMAGMSGPAAPEPVVVAAGAALALYLVLHAGRSVVVGVRTPAPDGPVGLGVLHRATASPGVRSACQAFMSAGMGLMLVVSLSPVV